MKAQAIMESQPSQPPIQSSPADPDIAYWYPERRHSSAVAILSLLREYRDADRTVRARTRRSMLLGETDLLALRHLLEAQSTGSVLRQKDLAARLSISTASASTLVDRLSKAGYLQRIPHPEDRRSVALELTNATQTKVHELLYAYKARQLEAVETLTEEEQIIVKKFLKAMIKAAE